MAFDAGFLSAVCREICEELTGSKLDRIFQCTRDTFTLEFRSAKKPRTLFLSTGPSGGVCYFTERKIPHPDVPPMFCMLLRKHLTGGRFLKAEQVQFERVLRLDIEFVDAFGDPYLRSLYLEMMGKNSNLVLCDERGSILGALRTLDLAQSSDRPLLCGMVYTPPPVRTGTVSLMDANLRRHVLDSFSACSQQTSAVDFLLATVGGIGPVLAREMVFRHIGDVSASVAQVNASQLFEELDKIRTCLEKGEFAFGAIVDKGNLVSRVVEYSYYPLSQYAGCDCVEFSSPSVLLDDVAGKRAEHERLRQRTERASSVLKAAVKRLKKKLDAQLSDQAAAEKCEQNRLFADLIMQESSRISRGCSSILAVDYNTGEEVKVLLDPRLSAVQNAQVYYKKYRKQKRALDALSPLLEETKAELEYAESVAESLKRVQDVEDADQICREISDWEYGKRFVKTVQKNSKKQKPPSIRVTSVTSPGGFVVLVGKNNLQNEEITFRLANKNDLWFHVKGKPGPHVVLHLEGGEEPGQEDLLFAARHCLTQVDSQDVCQVDYTRVKHVKHHFSRLPGRVVYSGERAIFVRKRP